MITLEQACEKVLNEHVLASDIIYVEEIFSYKNLWIISPYFGEEELFGPEPYSVNKITGEVEIYPEHEHLKVYRKAKKIEVPEKYKVNIEKRS